MRIGQLSRETKTSPRSLRYYEELGLIATTRQPNGYREYSEATVDTVRTIRTLLDLGFPTSLVGEVLSCNTTDPLRDDCSNVVTRMATIRDEMEAKAQQLGATSRTLTSFIERASAVSR
ncbi:MerR family transcriptional regulator [Glaciihabitans sp. dw_435]|uniref:MerR family transcriptional regulator n=1 Tax=Glaciihabitans sp. dw_435 TaxID=2720081 RepID=UPI001BD2F112|nr:MerR family transcriptional regulator [Glaciihabitans sp. dw_435]